MQMTQSHFEANISPAGMLPGGTGLLPEGGD